ncbi:MAG: DoxX family protein [Gemmatimonadales bacterium]|nr:DoxX family protein [Gemmatimonadales bacterium]
MTRADGARTGLALFFTAAGAMHFVAPAYYRQIVPSYLPAPDALVAASGVAEILGGMGLLVARVRPAAGVWLMALLVAIFPANVEMLRLFRARGVPPVAELLLWLRLPLQGVLIWWVWRLSRPNRQRNREVAA